MLTKQPDYIISELGYPQWQQPLYEDKLYKKCRPQPPSTSCSSSTNSSSTSSPNRLLPLRETLDDYYKRILLGEQRERLEICSARRGRDSDDFLAQQKRRKNQWNAQQQQQQRSKHSHNYNHIRNQNCRDKAQATGTTTTAAATTTTPPTLVTCDLNSF